MKAPTTYEQYREIMTDGLPLVEAISEFDLWNPGEDLHWNIESTMEAEGYVWWDETMLGMPQSSPVPIKWAKWRQHFLAEVRECYELHNPKEEEHEPDYYGMAQDKKWDEEVRRDSL